MMVGAAAAQKVIGHRIASAGNGALVALGGGLDGMSNDGACDDGEVGTVTALPKVGAGPNATREEMEAADENDDGVLSPEEQANLARSVQAAQDRKNAAASQNAAIAKKRSELVGALRSKVRS